MKTKTTTFASIRAENENVNFYNMSQTKYTIFLTILRTGVDGRGGREAGVRGQVQAVQVERNAVEGPGHRQDEGARRKEDGKNAFVDEKRTGLLVLFYLDFKKFY